MIGLQKFFFLKKSLSWNGDQSASAFNFWLHYWRIIGQVPTQHPRGRGEDHGRAAGHETPPTARIVAVEAARPLVPPSLSRRPGTCPVRYPFFWKFTKHDNKSIESTNDSTERVTSFEKLISSGPWIAELSQFRTRTEMSHSQWMQ